MATPSARNFGQSPLTSRVGGGNGFSRAFYDQNPDYMGAGDWRYTDRNPGDDGFRIDARVGASMPGTGPGTGNTSIPMGRGFSGLDYYHALQNRNLPAFRQPNQGTPWGMGNSAQEIGANMNQGGNMLLPNGRYVPDTMYNRTLGSMNPYSGGGSRIDKWGNQMAGGDMGMNAGNGGNQPQQGPNEDQQRWAQKFADSQRKPMAPTTPNQTGGNSLFGAVGLNPATGMGKNPSSFQGYSSPQNGAGPTAPTNFSRSALIEGARQSGDLEKTIANYNNQARAAGTGMQMDRNGNIVPLSKLADEQGTSPFARDKFGAGAEDIRARRDFARGEAPVQRGTENGVPTLTKMNPYGTATATLGPSTGVRQGMMPDPLTGQMVPMRQWAADQSAVQATKFGPDAGQAGNDYLNKGAISQQIASQMPAAQPAAPTRQMLASPYSRLPSGMTPNLASPVTSPLNVASNGQTSGLDTMQANNPFAPGGGKPLNKESGKRFHDLASGKVTPGMGAMIGGITGRR